MNTNPILNVDSYKTSHYLQYPPNAEIVSSYIESRGGARQDLVFFGLQMFIKKYLLTPITQPNIDEAETVLKAHGAPFNRKGWEYILREHNGFLPLQIDAIPEGTVLPSSHVMVQAHNTDPQCAWLTSYIETALLRAIWFPTTIASRSRYIKQMIAGALQKTSDNQDGLPFKLHDFGARGTSSLESASIGGAAHLVNFLGTDTLSGVIALRDYYGAEMAGFSIPAAEHSTITSWGREREGDAYENMLTQFAGEDKIVAVVSDSYDLWVAIDDIWGDRLREAVINSGGTVVVRPDSGDPVDIVCRTVESLMDQFGYITTSKGYRELPAYIRVIQGDGVNPSMIRHILNTMESLGLSADNIAFGMGAELLQKVDRDTFRFAMKASAIRINGEWHDVYKDPITDRGKKSKRGRLALVCENGEFETIRVEELEQRDTPNLLQTVFNNGDLLIETTLDEIRGRAQIHTSP